MEYFPEEKQFHKPQRKHAIVFLIGALVLSAIIVAWTFFLNKGTLVVAGEPPFSFSVRGEKTACNQASCKVKLKKSSYQIIGEKQGYRETTVDIAIERGKSAELSLEFSFIPQVRVAGALVLPHARAPLHASLLGKTKLENIPHDAEVVEIAESADRLLYVSDGVYAVTHNGKKITSPISRASPAALFGEGIAYLEKKGDGERLMFWNGTKNEVVFFPRAFIQPTIKTKNITIVITDRADTGYVHYVVDSKLKTRKRIPNAFETSDFSLAGNLLVAEENATMKAYDFETLQSVVLTGAISHHVAATLDGKLLFFADRKNVAEKSDDVVTISQALEDIETGVANVLGKGKIYLAEMDLSTGEAKTIVELQGSSIGGISLSEDGKKVLIAGDGQVYEVVLVE